MGRKSRNSYDFALARREIETGAAETFEAEFPVVTGRSIEIVSEGESPDRVALIAGIETGVELTLVKAGGADEIIAELFRLARQKSESYERRGIFDVRPIILLGQLDWPAIDVEGPSLYDVQDELLALTVPDGFSGLRFSEIWLMDDGPKYSSRQDPRAPADFFCFAPSETWGFWERERKRRRYWGLQRDSRT